MDSFTHQGQVCGKAATCEGGYQTRSADSHRHRGGYDIISYACVQLAAHVGLNLRSPSAMEHPSCETVIIKSASSETHILAGPCRTKEHRFHSGLFSFGCPCCFGLLAVQTGQNRSTIEGN